MKPKSLCTVHQAEISYICLAAACAKNRLCCQKCARSSHFRHNVCHINKITKPLSNLNCNSHNENPKQNIAKLQEDYTAMSEEFKQILALIFNTEKFLQENYWSQYALLMETFQDRLVDQVYYNLTCGQDNGDYVQDVVAKLKFLDQESFEEADKVFKVSKEISNKGVLKIRETFQKVKAQIDELMRFFEKYNFNNIKDIAVQESFKASPARNQSQVRPMSLMIDSQDVLQIKNPKLSLAYGQVKKFHRPNSEIKKQLSYQKPLNIQNFESETMRKLDQLFQQFQSNQKTFQIPSNLIGRSQRQFQQDNLAKGNNLLEIQSQSEIIFQYKSTNQRVTITVPLEKVFKKQQIIRHIQILPQQLSEYVIIGQSQFDLDCLRVLVNNAPHLTKFNYGWNFEQDGFKMQYEQVFMEKKLSIFQRKLSSTTYLFQLYSQLPFLENIQIDKIQIFSEEKVLIKNRNIKHLTIGEYAGQFKSIPSHVLLEVSKLRGLQSLNIFNIKEIEDPLFIQILRNNKQTLKNLWISQCCHTSQEFMFEISTLSLKSIIFDNVTIKCSFTVPTFIQTFLMETCKCTQESRFPIRGLRNCQNIKNFSIYDSKFRWEIGNELLQQLTANNKKIEYLNIGSQWYSNKKINNGIVNYLKILPNLKWLNINHTKIIFEPFIHQLGFMEVLQKFGAVGLPHDKNQESLKQSIEKLGLKCPNLEILHISYKSGLEQVNYDKFLKKIKIFFVAEHPRLKEDIRSKINKFRKVLQQKGIKASF